MHFNFTYILNKTYLPDKTVDNLSGNSLLFEPVINILTLEREALNELTTISNFSTLCISSNKGNKIYFVSLLVVTSKASYFTDRVPSILHRLKFRQSLPYFFALYSFILILNII